MNNGKYIVLNDSHIIIFDATMSHKEVAVGFKSSTITSAGFITTVVDADTAEVAITCYGKSVTLELSANTDDYLLAEYAMGVI